VYSRCFKSILSISSSSIGMPYPERYEYILCILEYNTCRRFRRTHIVAHTRRHLERYLKIPTQLSLHHWNNIRRTSSRHHSVLRQLTMRRHLLRLRRQTRARSQQMVIEKGQGRGCTSK
jgi:hypothetical protein